jgi:predicted DCC family thiol-disulfide oxidoreductase YuxK
MATSAVLVFDGDCGFCTQSARWIESHWSEGVAEAVAWQQLDGDTMAHYGLTISDVTSQVWWIDEDGRRGANRAVSAALRHSIGRWKWAGLLLDLPPISWAARPGYFLVARYRHLLPGATENCRL